MRKYLYSVISILPLLFVANAGQGQCTGPYCSPEIGYGSYSYRYQERGRYVQPYSDRSVPEELKLKISRSSVIVYAETSYRGMLKKGSGTLVRWSERLAVITAGHVVEPNSKHFIVFRGKRIECQLIDYDNNEDVAILEPLSDQEELYEAAVEPATGVPDFSEVFLAGYDGGNNLRIVRARRVQILNRQAFGSSLGYGRSFSWIVYDQPSRQGDSGGGAFLADGKLAAVIHSTDYSNTWTTWIESVNTRLNRSLSCFRWRFRQKGPEGTPVPTPRPGENPDEGQKEIEPAPNPEGNNNKPEVNPPANNEEEKQEKAEPKVEPKPAQPETPQTKQQSQWEALYVPTLYVLTGFMAFLVMLGILNVLWTVSVARRR